MLRRKIISLVGIVLLSSNTYAEKVASEVGNEKLPVISDLNIQLKAYAAFESGFNSQNHLATKEKKVSANKEGFAFYNDTALFATISNKANDVEYGSKIILVPTAKRKGAPEYNGSHIFISSEYGKVELGSPIPAATSMMISDGSVPAKYIKKSSVYLNQDKKLGASFLTSNGCFLGDELTANLDKAPYSSEPPRTINYYTPKFAFSESSKVQLGISYTPDTANTGIGGVSEKSDGMQKKTIGATDLDRFEIDRAVKDAVSAGIKLEQKFKDNIELKLAVTGEYGKSTGVAKKFTNKDDKSPKEYKLANLRSYNIGGELKLSDFTYSACYGSLGKSLTTAEFHKSGRNSHYYSLGAAYKYNATTTKLSYYASEQFKNKVSSVKLNISHVLAKGLKPYAEISSYTLKGKPEFYNELKSRTTKGTVALIGVKLTL